MKLPGAPQLKAPKPRVPGFLGDLYHDLRDRRLLPLIALVVVAIAATPILLGQHSETAPPAAAGSPFATLKEARDRGTRLTVVQATPGLRDYRKRLRDRSPTDPFRKTTAKPDLGGAQLGGGSEGGSGESATSASTTVKETSTTTTTESTTGGQGTGGSTRTVRYVYAIDVSIVHSTGSEAEGNKQSEPPESRTHVMPASPLPDEKHQVVGYLGTSPKTHNPLFLVSGEVTGTFGEGHCAFGAETCEMIELEPGFPEVFELGPSNRYVVKVTKVELVAVGDS